MPAKITAKNQLAFPKWVVEALGCPAHFAVGITYGRFILTPLGRKSANAVRYKLQRLGLVEGDVTDAVAWARRGHERPFA